MNRITRLVALGFILLSLPISSMAKGDDKDKGDEVPYYGTEKDNDVQFRTGFEVEKKFQNHFSLAWSEELRLKQDIQRLDRIYSDFTLAYKSAPWLKFSAGYTFISVNKKGKEKDNFKKYWDLRHRVTASVALSHKTKSNWVFSLKERVQTTFLTENDIDKREKSDPVWVLKSKVMAEYKYKKVPLNPYVSVELCNTLNAPGLADGNYLEKVRSAIGAVYRINKKNCIDFYYRFDYNLDKKINVRNSTGKLKSLIEKTAYNSIFSMSYKYKF